MKFKTQFEHTVLQNLQNGSVSPYTTDIYSFIKVKTESFQSV